jgi:hypothetical protein
VTSASAILIAIGLFGTWTLATYLLEGRIRTFQRPEAAGARFRYTVSANMLVGTIGAALLVRLLLREAAMPQQTAYGLAQPDRIPLTLAAGAILGGLTLTIQRLPSRHPVVLANAFAQVLVVSIAEVLVCWAVLGATVRNALGGGLPGTAFALVTAALAFGLYHYAHSPPFNTARMVLFLTGVGLATGIFFFVSGDLYGTIVFHNAFALRGVVEALRRSGALQRFERPQLPLLATAALAALVLIVADLGMMRPALSAATP